METQKNITTNIEILKEFYRLSKNGLHGKTMELVHPRLCSLYKKSDGTGEEIEQKIETTSTILKFYDDLDCLIFEKRRVTNNKPKQLRFCVLGFSDIPMHEKYYNELKKDPGELQLQYLGCDSIFLFHSKSLHQKLRIFDDFCCFS